MISNTNSKTATLHIYELLVGSSMIFRGVEFFDRIGQSLTRVGDTTGNRKEIRLNEDERVVGLIAFTIPRGSLYDVRFKLAKVV